MATIWIKCGDCADSWGRNTPIGNNIKKHGLCLRCLRNLESRRYRWLRDNKHLDMWWSVEGPKDRCKNIDADIDEAMRDA